MEQCPEKFQHLAGFEKMAVFTASGYGIILGILAIASSAAENDCAKLFAAANGTTSVSEDCDESPLTPDAPQSFLTVFGAIFLALGLLPLVSYPVLKAVEKKTGRDSVTTEVARIYYLLFGIFVVAAFLVGIDYNAWIQNCGIPLCAGDSSLLYALLPVFAYAQLLVIIPLALGAGLAVMLAVRECSAKKFADNTVEIRVIKKNDKA